MDKSVLERTELTFYCEAVCFGFFYPADYAGLYAEAFGNLDHAGGMLRSEIDFHAVSHVEHLVHLFPVGSRFALNQVKQRRHGEHVVLYHMLVLDKVHDFGLGASRAVNHAVDVGTHLVEKLLDNGGVGAGGRQNELTGVDRRVVDGVGEAHRT